MGSVSSIIRSALTAGVGVVLLSWGIAGPFKSRMDMVSRMFILFGGLLLIFPGFTTMSAGIGLALTGWLVTLIEKKRQHQPNTNLFDMMGFLWLLSHDHMDLIIGSKILRTVA